MLLSFASTCSFQSEGQVATSDSPSVPPIRGSRQQYSRESPYRPVNLGKSELLQELCVTQCIRGGYEMSRLAYSTCFPAGKKPNFIYLPQLKC